jgi:Flp pilus assembly protein TadG
MSRITRVFSHQTAFLGRIVPGRARSGAVTLEAILVIPILVITLMAAFVYGSIVTVHHAVMAAATEGAREAAKVPTTLGATDGSRILDAAELTVEEVLSTHGLTVSATSGVMVIVEDSTSIGCRGETIITCPGATTVAVTDTATVRVTVVVKFEDANIPNLLSSFGVNFTGEYLQLCSDSKRDCS